jgi:hypothetical protein
VTFLDLGPWPDNPGVRIGAVIESETILNPEHTRLMREVFRSFFEPARANEYRRRAQEVGSKIHVPTKVRIYPVGGPSGSFKDPEMVLDQHQQKYKESSVCEIVYLAMQLAPLTGTADRVIDFWTEASYNKGVWAATKEHGAGLGVSFVGDVFVGLKGYSYAQKAAASAPRFVPNEINFGRAGRCSAPVRSVPNEINFGRAGRTVPNEINFGRAGRVVPDEINVADQLWQQTWREAQGMNLNPRRVVEGAIDLETGVPAVRASGTPPASSLALPAQAEQFPPGVCGMPRAVQAVMDQTGATDTLILVTQGGFRFRNGRWYYVSPCRNCEGIFELNPNLQRSPLPPGVPPGLPPRTQVPFTPPPGW